MAIVTTAKPTRVRAAGQMGPRLIRADSSICYNLRKSPLTVGIFGKRTADIHQVAGPFSRL